MGDVGRGGGCRDRRHARLCGSRARGNTDRRGGRRGAVVNPRPSAPASIAVRTNARTGSESPAVRHATAICAGGAPRSGRKRSCGKPAPTAVTAEAPWQVIATPAATAPNASSNEVIRVPARNGLPPRNASSDQKARARGSAPSTQIQGSSTTSSGRTWSRRPAVVLVHGDEAVLREHGDHRDAIVEEGRPHERDVHRPLPGARPPAGGGRRWRARVPPPGGGRRTAASSRRPAGPSRCRTCPRAASPARPGAWRRAPPGRVQRLQDLPRVRQQPLARRGQDHPARGALEQRDADAPLELTDLGGQRLLRERTAARAARVKFSSSATATNARSSRVSRSTITGR